MSPGGLDVAPVRLGSNRRGRGGPLAVAALLAVFVVVAVAKPWVPPSPGRVATPSQAPVVVRSPAASTEPRASEPAGPADPIAARGDWSPVSSIVHEVAFHGGTWGAAAASWKGVESQWVDWLELRARPGEAPGDAAGTALREAACREGRLRSSPRIVAVTGPAALLEGIGVSVWQLRRTPFPIQTDLRIDFTRDAPGVVFLVLGSGRAWPDGAYRLIVRSGVRPPIGLDVCVGSLPSFGRPMPIARRG
ncbi:MAG TPA: hypothetical protein VFI28_07860 [Candidatus Limnocylindrales bacterium]|nr:hypothetical protein [Candidatus Limnocylindrales bacterium]